MFNKEEKIILKDEMNLREIREMITFLKDSNVRTFEGMGISVEFNVEMDEQPQVVPFRDPVESDMVTSHFNT
jgi:hypothetical protein|tara:strand:- start:1873 stop:2088 length:216 start_codon:yes stop_codon:yes gene_type:complete